MNETVKLFEQIVPGKKSANGHVFFDFVCLNNAVA